MKLILYLVFGRSIIFFFVKHVNFIYGVSRTYFREHENKNLKVLFLKIFYLFPSTLLSWFSIKIYQRFSCSRSPSTKWIVFLLLSETLWVRNEFRLPIRLKWTNFRTSQLLKLAALRMGLFPYDTILLLCTVDEKEWTQRLWDST